LYAQRQEQKNVVVEDSDFIRHSDVDDIHALIIAVNLKTVVVVEAVVVEKVIVVEVVVVVNFPTLISYADITDDDTSS